MNPLHSDNADAATVRGASEDRGRGPSWYPLPLRGLSRATVLCGWGASVLGSLLCAGVLLAGHKMEQRPGDAATAASAAPINADPTPAFRDLEDPAAHAASEQVLRGRDLSDPREHARPTPASDPRTSTDRVDAAPTGFLQGLLPPGVVAAAGAGSGAFALLLTPIAFGAARQDRGDRNDQDSGTRARTRASQ
jgi:hypothetical protein